MSSTTTKKAIAFSFKELLFEKQFSKITVNDIAEQCDINRQTFYYHFHDIPELIEWICIEDVNKVLKGKGDFATWQEGFISILELIKEDKRFVVNIFTSISYDMLTENLYRLVYPVIRKVTDEKADGVEIKEEDKKFITEFYMYSFVSIVLKWCSTGMKETPSEIVGKISQIVTGSLEPAIHNFAVKK